MSPALTRFTPNVVVGLGVSLLGVALLVDALGIAEARSVLRLWPILLVLLGAAYVAQAVGGSEAAERRERPLISAPAVFLAILIGVPTLLHFERRAVAIGDETTSTFSVMGRRNASSGPGPISSAEVGTVIGRASLDLREAVPPNDEIVVDVFTILGETSIRIPQDWVVDVQLVPVMGQVQDLRGRAGARNTSGDTAPTSGSQVGNATTAGRRVRLIIRGFILLGQLEVRS